MEGFGSHAQCFGKRLRSYRQDHEFLDIHVVISMCSAVEDIHHRYRQHLGIDTAKIIVERQFKFHGRRFGNSHGNAKNRIRSQFFFVGSPVERQHGAINDHLL